MKLCVAAVLLVLALAARGNGSSGSAPKKGPTLKQRIDGAVSLAVTWLEKQLDSTGLVENPDFGRPGATALMLYALAAAGRTPDDRVVWNVVNALSDLGVRTGSLKDLKAGPPELRMTATHAFLILALAKLDALRYQRVIQRSAKALERAQLKNGEWNYIVTLKDPFDGGDNVNTELALLALHEAKLDDVPVPDEVWMRAARHFEKTQGADGGWGYGNRRSFQGSYGSTTAGGVAGLVITIGMLMGPERAAYYDFRKDPTVGKGLAWLAGHFAVDHHPGIALVKAPEKPKGKAAAEKKGFRGPGESEKAQSSSNSAAHLFSKNAFHFFWLYSLETAAKLLSMKDVGKHDWYEEGAKWLIAHQQSDGAWDGWDEGRGGYGDADSQIVVTSFAVLFLTRPTPSIGTEGLR